MRKLVFLILSLFFCLPLIGAKQAKQAKEGGFNQLFDSLFIDAMYLRSTGKTAEAAAKYDSCYQINPNSSIVCYELAKLYLASNDKIKALAYLKKAADTDKDNYFYQLALAHEYQNQRLFDQAAAVYKHIIKKFPDKEEPYYNLAIAYLMQEKYDKAVDALDDMEEKVGASKFISLSRFRALVAQKKYKEALKDINKTIKAYPLDASLWIYKGDIEMALGKKESAVESYLEATRIEKDYGDAYLALCSYYMNERNKEKVDYYVDKIFASSSVSYDDKMYFFSYALDNYNVAKLDSIYGNMLAADKENAKLHFSYGRFLTMLKKYREAVEAYRTATYLDPQCTQCWLDLLSLTYNNKDSVAFKQVLSDAMDAVPTSAEFYYFSAALKYQEQDIDSAFLYVNKAKDVIVEKTDKGLKVDIYMLLGSIYYDKDDIDKAIDNVKEAARVDSTNLLVLNNLAYFLALGERELDYAKKISNYTILSDPTNATYLDTYAYILFIEKQYARALFYIEKAVEYHAGLTDKKALAEVYERYGDILYFNNQKEKALIAWEEAFFYNPNNDVLKQKIQTKEYVQKK